MKKIQNSLSDIFSFFGGNIISIFEQAYYIFEMKYFSLPKVAIPLLTPNI